MILKIASMIDDYLRCQNGVEPESISFLKKDGELHVLDGHHLILKARVHMQPHIIRKRVLQAMSYEGHVMRDPKFRGVKTHLHF
jgi:hypothetical protein